MSDNMGMTDSESLAPQAADAQSCGTFRTFGFHISRCVQKTPKKQPDASKAPKAEKYEPLAPSPPMMPDAHVRAMFTGLGEIAAIKVRTHDRVKENSAEWLMDRFDFPTKLGRSTTSSACNSAWVGCGLPPPGNAVGVNIAHQAKRI